jgi:colanic acid biosynthesis glycosyl transferase WcaI
MRVLILSQYFAPEPVPKPTELAEELAERGHDVTVITGVPNYPSGQIYPSYNQVFIRKCTHKGIRIIRTFEFPYHGTNAIGRILNYVSFMISAPLGALGGPGWDVMYVWHPPLTVGVAAWIISRMRRVPFVYDVQDIWPESAVLAGVLREGWLVRVLARMERFVYRQAGHIAVVTDGAKANLIGKGVPAKHVSVMPHWIDDEPFTKLSNSRDTVRVERGWSNRFVVMFAGNLGLAQGLETLIDAVALCPMELPIVLCFVGDGTDRSRLRAMTDSRGLSSKIEFLDRYPQSEMPTLLAAADCLLVHLKRSEISQFVIPTKTLAYLASGTPLLMAMDGAAADLVRAARAGWVIPPEDPAAMCTALVDLMAQPTEARVAMGKRGQEFVKATLTKKVVIPQYEALLTGIAKVS